MNDYSKYIERPSKELIDKYLKKFDQDKRYKLADDAINKLLEEFPLNNSIENTLLKVTVINNLYSTNIYGTYRMAEHIQQLNIDKEVQNGNPNIVHQIATGHGIVRKKTKKELNFYSFATKYCNWHNKDEYPIYDKFVKDVLVAYNNKYGFSSFKKTDLKEFCRFKEILEAFKEFFDLDNYDLKKIDKFLWLYGKEKYIFERGDVLSLDLP